MLSIMLAASLGGQPACRAATGYGLRHDRIVLRTDGTKLKMPPNGRSLNQDEWQTIHAAFDEVDQEATLASNTRGGR
jgi:hypothetical protein